LAGPIEILALGWSSFGILACSRWSILPTRFGEFSRNRGLWRLRYVPPVISGERKRGLLGCRERNPERVFVRRATFGVSPMGHSKRFGIPIVALAFAAVVAGDCGDRGIGLLVVELFVFAVPRAIPLAFFRDRTRELGLALGGTIEPTNDGRWGGPDDVTTAEVVPNSKREDEQEKSEYENQVEEGKGLENAVASVIYLVRIALDVVLYEETVFFCPTFNVGIGNLRVGDDCTQSEPEDGEDAEPEKFPSGLCDHAQLAVARHEEQSEEHEKGNNGSENGKWHK